MNPRPENPKIIIIMVSGVCLVMVEMVVGFKGLNKSNILRVCFASKNTLDSPTFDNLHILLSMQRFHLFLIVHLGKASKKGGGVNSLSTTKIVFFFFYKKISIFPLEPNFVFFDQKHMF